MKTIRIVCMLLCFSSVSLFGVIESIGEELSDNVRKHLKKIHEPTSLDTVDSVPIILEAEASSSQLEFVARVDRFDAESDYFLFSTSDDINHFVNVVKNGYGERVHWYRVDMDVFKEEVEKLATLYEEKEKGKQ